MNLKFDPKKYQDKKRIYRPVAGTVLITRIFMWDEDKAEYREPLRGSRYLARRVEMVEGKRKLLAQSFDTLDEAKCWQSKVSSGETQTATQVSECRRAEPEVTPPVTGPLFREVVEEWKGRCFPRLAKGTQLNYEKYLRLHFVRVMDVPILDINSRFVDDWLDDRKRNIKKSGAAKIRKSFEHELTLLGVILRYYIEYNDDTPFLFPIKKRHREAVRLLNRSSSGKKSQDLTLEEFFRFREALARNTAKGYGNLLVAMATVQYFQALRISEVAALHWEDVNLEWRNPKASRLTVKRHVAYLRKKGDAAYVEEGFKNASKDEPVKEQPLFPESFEAFKTIFRLGAKGLVFRNKRATFFTYRQIQHAFDEAFADAGLPYTGTHVLRHGGTRNVYNETGDLAIAQQILGNSNLQTTLVYAKRHKGALTKLAESHWDKLPDRVDPEADSVTG